MRKSGISVTNQGELLVAGEGFQVALRLEVHELRQMAATLDAVADRIEDEASDLATVALNRAAGRLQ